MFCYIICGVIFFEIEFLECEEDGEGKSIVKESLFEIIGLLYFVKFGLFRVCFGFLFLV